MKWVLLVSLLLVSTAWASVYSNTLYYDAASAVDQLLISKGYEGQVMIGELSGENCYWVYYPDRFFVGSVDDAELMMTAFVYVGVVSRETSWESSLVFVVLRNKTFILPTVVAQLAYEAIMADRATDAMVLLSTNTTDLEIGTDEMREAGEFPFSSSISTSETQYEQADTEDDFDYVNTVRPDVVSSIGSIARSRLLRASDLAGLSYREIKLVRNYIYACYDRPFVVEWISDYYFQYMDDYSGDGIANPRLTSTESANIAFIQEYESDNDIPVMND